MYLKQVTINAQGFPTRRLYPFSIPILADSLELAFQSPVCFFVGENGSGKSTVLDAISRKCGAHPWDKPRRHVAHHNPFETRLVEHVSTVWANGRVPASIFRAETFREFADFLDDVALCDPGRLQYHGGNILTTLSHGQGILSYFQGRYQQQGLYFLDEPEAALSPASQIRFLQLLRKFETQGHAQFIIATHSPILLGYPGAQILSFNPPHIQEVAYTDTEHYKLYSSFLADRSAFLGGAGQRESTFNASPSS